MSFDILLCTWYNDDVGNRSQKGNEVMITYTSYGTAVFTRECGTIPGCIPVSKDDHMFHPSNSPYRVGALGWNAMIHHELQPSRLMGEYTQSTIVLLYYLLKQFPKP